MTRTRTLVLAAACTMTGAGGALATEAITSSAHMGRHHSLRAWHTGPGFFLGRTVHAEAVLATRDGFKNLTYDRGIVKSVGTGSLTLTEGKGTTTREETVTIPSGARIHVAGVENATLSDVKDGMKAVVVSLGDKTTVFAHAPRS